MPRDFTCGRMEEMMFSRSSSPNSPGISPEASRSLISTRNCSSATWESVIRNTEGTFFTAALMYWVARSSWIEQGQRSERLCSCSPSKGTGGDQLSRRPHEPETSRGHCQALGSHQSRFLVMAGWAHARWKVTNPPLGRLAASGTNLCFKQSDPRQQTPRLCTLAQGP